MELEPPRAFEAKAPQCAAHPGAQAHGTCKRCGNFVCPLCLDPFGPWPEHCEACREREGAGVMAWERGGSWIARWWQTTRAVVLRPSETFAHARPQGAGPALGYAAVTGALIGVVVGVLLGLLVVALGAIGLFGGGSEDALLVAGVAIGTIVLYPLMSVLWILASVLLRTFVYHGTVALMGGRGGFAASLWTNAYLHAFQTVMIPIAVVQQIPIIGPFVGLFAYLAIEVMMAVQLTRAAERHHGLEGGRAAFAGWSVLILLTGLGALCCVGMGVLMYPLHW